jgi:phosphoenolpyruvate synthase/pyruvate phosphate dikinase
MVDARNLPSESSQSGFDLLRLSDPACQDPALVGSKAATLARLFHVLTGAIPPGVALPAPQSGFFANITGTDCHTKASQILLDALGDRSPSSARQYAVRSSALEEDSTNNSFAGQYKTTLGLASARDIITAVEDCVRSATSEQVATYRRAAAMHEPIKAPGVLIQEMIPADRAGVAFTVNPVTGRDEVIINASYGLGDLLVSGEITPDEIIIDDSSLSPRYSIGSKRMMSILTHRGVIRTSVPESLQVIPCLSDAQVSSIAMAARTCEASVGCPVDVEWALNGEKLFVLQARPITAMSDRRRST